MKTGNIINSTLVILFILSVGLACSGLTKGKELGEKAVTKFHQQLAEEKFSEIYAGVDDEYKKVSTEQESIELFQAVSRKLGKVKTAELQSWNSNATTNGSFTVLVYQTAFEKDKGVETFTFRIVGDEAKIVGYNVNSPAFMK